MKRAAFAALILAAGCDRFPRPAPKKAPAPEPSPSAIEVVSPTPTPPPLAEVPQEGEYSLAVSGTANGCNLASPPASVWITGIDRDREIVSQPFADASGRWDGRRMILSGSVEESHRPTVNCVLEKKDRWDLWVPGAPGHLEGRLVRSWNVLEGGHCAEVARDKAALPCVTDWTIALDFKNSSRAPKVLESAATPDVTPPASAAPTPKKKKKPR